MMPPVLFIVWRRPETTMRVLEAIRQARPSCLFIACDGPRSGRRDEAIQVQATRDLIDQGIDWPCEVHRRYSELNQGCKNGVSAAISWFFENVEEGIILEDDCLPHPSFFTYCDELLKRYRHDTRIWCISGNNFQKGAWRGDASYYFSRYSLIWGWATWRRCWIHYDKELTNWDRFKDSNQLETIYSDPVEQDFWRNSWERFSSSDPLDTWDFQWQFTCISQGGLTTVPNRNLVTNIGYGGDGTHCSGVSPDPGLGEGFAELSHPRFILRDAAADQWMFETIYGGAALRESKRWLPICRDRLRSWRSRLFGPAKRSLQRAIGRGMSR